MDSIKILTMIKYRKFIFIAFDFGTRSVHVISLRDVYCDGLRTVSDWHGLKKGPAACYCRHDGHELRRTHILTICCC